MFLLSDFFADFLEEGVPFFIAQATGGDLLAKRSQGVIGSRRLELLLQELGRHPGHILPSLGGQLAPLLFRCRR